MLPEPFVQQMRLLLGAEYPDFEAALSGSAPVSLRLHPHKRPEPASLLPACNEPVPWHPRGCYLPERPIFTLDPLFHAGAYYVQEASSMFLAEALRQTVDFSQPLRVLDLCAAPGGKSTLLLDLIGPDSLLLANETVRNRAAVLRENLEKWGYANVAVSNAETRELAALESFFDLVVTDAPCSGEGLFRKDPDAVREWSPAQVQNCAVRQQTILADAVTALAPGGILAYSTCTYNRQENEENANRLIQVYGLEPLPLHTPGEWGIENTGLGCRFYPHRTRGEGFFIALFRKPGDKSPGQSHGNTSFKTLKPLPKNLAPAAAQWLSAPDEKTLFQLPGSMALAVPSRHLSTLAEIDKKIKNKWFGVPIGLPKGHDWIPEHGLALNAAIRPDLPAADLDIDQARQFLKKSTFELPAGAPKGWLLARYGGLNLGWMKNLGPRFNNYLPVERRIRMEIG